ncbi:MAG TPA: sigma-70 family RNA polymerase sigma factor [Kofleriaceae bacterium]|nr:sigma-70 family RNA polymerase sigma factor [Kofleriaceae bacterium]
MARTARPYLELDDLISIGTEALLRASERFDPARAVPFGSFAYLRVRGAMVEGIGRVGPHSRGVIRRRAGRAPRPAPLSPCPYDDGRHAGRSRRELADWMVDSLDRERLAPRLGVALAQLSHQERALVERHYFAGESLLDIGRDLGISKSWASRVHGRALGKLRRILEGEPVAGERSDGAR